MSNSSSPRIPLLSQSPSTSNANEGIQNTNFDPTSSPTDEQRRSLSRSRQRKASLVSSKGSFDSSMSASISAVCKATMNGMDNSKNGPFGSDKEYAGGYSSTRTSKRMDQEEGEEDDLIAIPGEETLLHENINERTYSQMNGRHTSDTIRSRADLMRKITINLALIGSWFFFSTLINLYNSWLFSDKHYHFSYPLFTTSLHMFVQFGLSSILMCVCHENRKIVPRQANGKRAHPTRRDWASKVVPCALATALDIGLSNLSLKTITLTFYTMCKSSNLAFVLFFAFLFKLEKLRLSLIGIIILITIGVIMMVAAETKFVLTGAIQVLTASAMGGLRWALTQMLLHKENMGMNNPIATIFWLSPLMGTFMILSSLIIEDWWAMFNSLFFKDIGTALETIFLMIAPGLIAFMMNLSEFALIQRTSVMTLSVAGIFKEILTILLSSNVFGDELSPINVTGLCVALTGIAMYNYLKYNLLVKNSLNQGNHRLEDVESCTEMGGTILPGNNSSNRGGGNGTYSQIPGGEDQVETQVDGVELTEEEMDRRRKREEEAEMAGWHNSGVIRTGDGYDDGDSDHTT